MAAEARTSKQPVLVAPVVAAVVPLTTTVGGP